MSELKKMALDDLVDLLSSQTFTYMKLLRAGATREQFQKLREQIREIQLEIETRKTTQEFPITDVNIPATNFTKNPTSSPQVENSN
jgi:hypothetical protein